MTVACATPGCGQPVREAEAPGPVDIDADTADTAETADTADTHEDPACRPFKIDAADPRLRRLSLGEYYCSVRADGRMSCWWGAAELRDEVAHPLVGSMDVDTGTFSLAVQDGGRARGILHASSADCLVRDDYGVSCWSGSEALPYSYLDVFGDQACGATARTVAANLGCYISDGRLVCRDDVLAGYADLVSLQDTWDPRRSVVDLFAGRQRACVLTDDDHLVCWMSDTSGWRELEVERPVRQVAFTDAADCILYVDGTIACAAPRASALALDAAPPLEQTLVEVVFSEDFTGRPVALSQGVRHLCALFDDGKVGCWGNNLSGALGTGTGVDVNVLQHEVVLPVHGLPPTIELASRFSQTCALVEAEDVWCWGAIDQRLARPVVEPTEPLAPLADRGVSDLSMRQGTACVIADGDVLCWGNNESGQLGNSSRVTSPEPTVVELPRAALQVRVGVKNVCAVVDDGSVYCWGSSAGVGVDTGDVDAVVGPTLIEGLGSITEVFVSLSPVASSFGVDTAGRVWVWGEDWRDGETVTLDAATDVQAPQPIVRLVAGVAKRVVCGVSTDGDVWCYHDGVWHSAPQLAGMRAFELGGGAYLLTDALELSALRGFYSSSLDDVQLEAEVATDVTDVSCGARCCAVTTDGGLLCNRDKVDQWKPVDFPDPVSRVAVDELSACVLTDSGHLRCFGNVLIGSLDDESPVPVRLLDH